MRGAFVEDARPIDSHVYVQILIVILNLIADSSPCPPSRLVEVLSRNSEFDRRIKQEFPGGMTAFVQACLARLERNGLIQSDGEAVVLTAKGRATNRRLTEPPV